MFLSLWFITCININGFFNILLAAKENKIKRVVYASSSSVYGDEKELPKVEHKTGSVLSPYAATKAAAELLAQSYNHSFSMPIVITRGNNVYGPNQYPEKVIPKFISQLKSNNKITIQGDGSCIRAFLHSSDTSTAFLHILEKGKIGEIYNIGCDESMEYSIKEVAEILIKMIKNTDEFDKWIEYIEDRPFNDKRYYISNQKLKDLGIDVVQELKGVGENLQDHLMFRPIYKIQGLKSLNKKVNSLFGKLMIGLEYVFNRSGPMTMGASQMCMFAKSDPSLELPDLQWHVQPMSMDTLGATKNHDFHAFTPTVSNIRPTSRGHVSIVDKDSRTYAKIKMNYLSTDHDRMIAARGLKLTRKIVMESETFKKYKPEEYRPGIDINDDEELVKAGSDFAQTIFHPVGTCKMGQDDMAVVDEKLKVKGIENLRVIDASIMPNITSGNTNAPTIMIAEKGADMILTH